MAKLAARYPNADVGATTWEAYWEDLRFIPKRFLLDGLLECRYRCKFFPAVAEIVEASVGTHSSIVPPRPYGPPATVADIVRAYQEKYRLVQLPPAERRKELEDKR